MTATLKDVFIASFTLEILKTVRAKQEKLEKELFERKRVQKLIEIERLKRKFAEYLVSAKPEEIRGARVPLIKPSMPLETKVALKMISQPLEKSIVHKPSMPPVIFEQSEPNILPVSSMKPLVIPVNPSVPVNLPPKPVVQTNLALPVPIAEGEFNQISSLINDPSVNYIECSGDENKVIIKKSGKIIQTELNLTKKDIKDIIDKFSEKTRIPLVEGVLKARYKNLEISGVSSDIINSSFVIKKEQTPQQPNFNYPNARQPYTQGFNRRPNIFPMKVK
jgi:hypothetical protein